MIRESKQDQDLTYLSSYISKVLKLKFGKGPETCFATRKNNILVIRVQNFMTPTETVLWKKGEANLALKVRSVLLASIFEEIKTDISMLLGLSISTFYHDWDFTNNQGVLLFVAGSGLAFEETHLNESFELTLCQRIQTISGNIHKRPKQLNVLMASSTLCIVESVDVLLSTENLLYDSGYHDILMERSDVIRRSYNQYLKEFAGIVGAEISQFFLIWDYEQNKSYIILFLK